MAANFHEIRFPLAIAFGSTGGPERQTEIVTLNSGYEERNARWADSRRRYNAGTGVHALADLHTLSAFFEERRGRLYGFRWRDRTDWKSCAPDKEPQPTDQTLGTGDGATKSFRLAKVYGASFAPWMRAIAKPVDGSVRVALGGVEQVAGWSVETTTGLVSFDAAPANGVAITAGFLFDVPVRFDTDSLSIDLSSFAAGEAPSVPIVEIRL
ncbi:TIGR02217 family protein [Faunimonas pinastri]|uniref:TIGR02217 family protein n=1 Tax=Faunimonas pinastri TaxID=1855383 RepID=A0A1H9M862_9HYPH|nr:DUF2460 domain-containing protein [Faunimonas pinastri]SER19868.1 TIGR02217 family protein [Faunimonas pinastri]